MNDEQRALAADISRHRTIVYVIRGRPGERDRPAMPSGHPVSWGVITEGTVIEGAKYPHPVFVR